MEAGWTPEVLVTTCGASLSASIAQLSDDPKMWKEFLESEAFYEFVLSLLVNRETSRALPAISRVLGVALDRSYEILFNRPEVDRHPRLFGDGLVTLPLTSKLPQSREGFSPSKFRVVMVAAELKSGPDQVGAVRRGRKLYYEAAFTDGQTAPSLEGFSSPIAAQFPQSTVDAGLKIHTGISLYDAARASMAEPMLTNAKKIGGKYYLAGSMDSYPIELAHHLANQVMATAISDISPIEVLGFGATYGFNINDRRKIAMKLPADYWLDFTTYTDELSEQKATFMPKIAITAEDGLHLVDHLPTSHRDFVRMVRIQWELGRGRALEALRQKPFSKKHIRNPQLGDGPSLEKLAPRLLQAVRVLEAPAISIEQTRAHHERDGQSWAGAALTTVKENAGVFAGFAALSAVPQLARKYLLDTNCNDAFGRLAEKVPAAYVIRARGLYELVGKLRALPQDQSLTQIALDVEQTSGTKFDERFWKRLLDEKFNFAAPGARLILSNTIVSTRTIREAGAALLPEGGVIYTGTRTIEPDTAPNKVKETLFYGVGYRQLGAFKNVLLHFLKGRGFSGVRATEIPRRTGNLPN